MFRRLPLYSEIKKFFIDNNTTLTRWSREQGFDPALVRDVAMGRNNATRGTSSIIKKTLLREFYTERD